MPRAKGRLLPSSLSRNQAYSALPLRAKILYPLIMANADDQGRLIAEPQMVKWDICPNVAEITRDDIGEVLAAMEEQELIRVYDAGGVRALQLLSWWADQASMQWAYPSEFVPPQDWDDRLRFRRGNQVITINWPGRENGSQTRSLADLQLDLSGSLEIAARKALGKGLQVNALGNANLSGPGNAKVSALGKPSPEPLPEPDKGKGKGKGNVKGKQTDSSYEESGDAAETASPRSLQTLTSYQDWAEKVNSARSGRETIGTLADFARAQYPRDAQGGSLGPSLDELCSNIGGLLTESNLDGVNLLKIMWRAASYSTDDFMKYVRGVVKNQEERYGGRERTAGERPADRGDPFPGMDYEQPDEEEP